MQPTQAALFVLALVWGVAMKMGYERLVDDPEINDLQVGYIALVYYGLIAATVLLSFWLGEGALLGYAIGILFVGAYQED
jgi:hypothetical protein